MYEVIGGIEQVTEFVFPDFHFNLAHTPALRKQKQREGEEDFRQHIARRMGFGDRLVAMDSESASRIRQILSWDIALFWKEKWSNWKRYGAIYYDQSIGSVEDKEVWLLTKPIWTIFTEDLSREGAIRRMCNPGDELKFSICRFGSANWTELAEKFGREVFLGTDQEEQFEKWYADGWESFKRTIDKIVEGERARLDEICT